MIKRFGKTYAYGSGFYPINTKNLLFRSIYSLDEKRWNVNSALEKFKIVRVKHSFIFNFIKKESINHILL